MKALKAYKDYIELNLERIDRGEFTPICFAEFQTSAEYIEQKDTKRETEN